MNVSYPPLENCSFKDEFEVDDLEYFNECGITADPKDYYFAVQEDEEGWPEAHVTPKKLWDEEERWSDCDYVVPILRDAGRIPGTWSDLSECVVSPPDGLTMDEVRADLRKWGFEENVAILCYDEDAEDDEFEDLVERAQDDEEADEELTALLESLSQRSRMPW